MHLDNGSNATPLKSVLFSLIIGCSRYIVNTLLVNHVHLYFDSLIFCFFFFSFFFSLSVDSIAVYTYLIQLILNSWICLLFQHSNHSWASPCRWNIMMVTRSPVDMQWIWKSNETSRIILSVKFGQINLHIGSKPIKVLARCPWWLPWLCAIFSGLVQHNLS